MAYPLPSTDRPGSFSRILSYRSYRSFTGSPRIDWLLRARLWTSNVPFSTYHHLALYHPAYEMTADRALRVLRRKEVFPIFSMIYHSSLLLADQHSVPSRFSYRWIFNLNDFESIVAVDHASVSRHRMPVTLSIYYSYCQCT
jgi:hypothetical protein